MKVLLTGATGFVGRRLAEIISSSDRFTLTSAVRDETSLVPGEKVVVGQLDEATDWSAALDSQEVIIHAAARAHVMDETAHDPLTEYRRVNVDGALRLAAQAADAGVKRFVFLSSIKVNGEVTPLGRPFTADDRPSPDDAYAISKFEAEEKLQELSIRTGMEVVIIRPPLVYGPGVKGNFEMLLRLVEKGLPLPFGAVKNLRSLVALDNLVDLIMVCIDHPAAANQVFLASDGLDLSTPALLRKVAAAQERRARLIPVPARLLLLGATLFGKRPMAQRILGSLQVDISKTQRILNWEPPLSVEEGLRRCVIAEKKA